MIPYILLSFAGGVALGFSICRDLGSSQKTESMVTPVFATPILTTSWLA